MLTIGFDAKNWDLSIYEVFRAIPALFHRFWSRYFYFPSSFLPWFLYSVWRLRSQNPILRWFSTPKKSKNSHAKNFKIKFLHEKKEFFFSDFFYIKHKVSAFQRNQLELLGMSARETACQQSSELPLGTALNPPNGPAALPIQTSPANQNTDGFSHYLVHSNCSGELKNYFFNKPSSGSICMILKHPFLVFSRP